MAGLSLGVATSSLKVSSERSLSSGLAVGKSRSGVDGALSGVKTLFVEEVLCLDDNSQLPLLRDKSFSCFEGLEISTVGLLLLTAVM